MGWDFRLPAAGLSGRRASGMDQAWIRERPHAAQFVRRLEDVLQLADERGEQSAPIQELVVVS